MIDDLTKLYEAVSTSIEKVETGFSETIFNVLGSLLANLPICFGGNLKRVVDRGAMDKEYFAFDLLGSIEYNTKSLVDNNDCSLAIDNDTSSLAIVTTSLSRLSTSMSLFDFLTDELPSSEDGTVTTIVVVPDGVTTSLDKLGPSATLEFFPSMITGISLSGIFALSLNSIDPTPCRR